MTKRFRRGGGAARPRARTLRGQRVGDDASAKRTHWRSPAEHEAIAGAGDEGFVDHDAGWPRVAGGERAAGGDEARADLARAQMKPELASGPHRARRVAQQSDVGAQDG